MNSCKKCGSYAINSTLHGREKGADLDLCDVCYWQVRAEERQAKIDALMLQYCPNARMDRGSKVP